MTGVAVPRGLKSGPGSNGATIYDVAQLAGVHASTVSRALNQPGRVSMRTQEKIENAARELNYQVNVFARALPTGLTQTIGLIVADITNPAYFDIIRGAGDAAAQNKHTLVLADSTESAEVELAVASQMLKTADGIILASPRMRDSDIQVLASRKPVVVINRRVEGVASLLVDITAGVIDAVRHLLAQGHRKVAYLPGPERSWMSARRWLSIEERCKWSGVEAVGLAPAAPTVDGGRQAARNVLESGATAVFCYNDLMAIGLMQELQLSGRSVPEALSIIGFDDSFGSDFTTPPLSTIKAPLRECAVQAMLGVLDQVAGRRTRLAPRLATELVLRGTVGKPPGP